MEIRVVKYFCLKTFTTEQVLEELLNSLQDRMPLHILQEQNSVQSIKVSRIPEKRFKIPAWAALSVTQKMVKKDQNIVFDYSRVTVRFFGEELKNSIGSVHCSLQNYLQMKKESSS